MESDKSPGAPKGNKNAIGNKGGGAPLGNQNAFKHGLYGEVFMRQLRCGYTTTQERELLKKVQERADWRRAIISAYLITIGYTWDDIYITSFKINLSLKEMYERIDWDKVKNS